VYLLVSGAELDAQFALVRRKSNVALAALKAVSTFISPHPGGAQLQQRPRGIDNQDNPSTPDNLRRTVRAETAEGKDDEEIETWETDTENCTGEERLNRVIVAMYVTRVPRKLDHCRLVIKHLQGLLLRMELREEEQAAYRRPSDETPLVTKGGQQSRPHSSDTGPQPLFFNQHGLSRLQRMERSGSGILKEASIRRPNTASNVLKLPGSDPA
jgi:hypothetical protein